MALTVFPVAAVAEPVSETSAAETLAEPVVDGVLIVTVGTVRFAPSGMFQKQSLTVVTPPAPGLLLPQDEPVATTNNWIALLVTAAPETLHESVPLASA